jgi:hypothetical protein
VHYPNDNRKPWPMLLCIGIVGTLLGLGPSRFQMSARAASQLHGRSGDRALLQSTSTSPAEGYERQSDYLLAAAGCATVAMISDIPVFDVARLRTLRLAAEARRSCLEGSGRLVTQGALGFAAVVAAANGACRDQS